MAKKLFSKISILFFLTVPFLAYSQEECNGPKPHGHGLKLLPKRLLHV